MTHSTSSEKKPSYRFDPFADVRLGRSLFEMKPEDWLTPNKDNPHAD